MIKKYFPLTILILILVGESIATGILPISRGWVFDLLQQHSALIWTAIFAYFINYLFLDLFQAVKGYAVTTVALVFRTDKTEHAVSNGGMAVSNIPQRIQEDIKTSYTSRIMVWSELFVSGSILVILLVQNISQPVLLASALGYAGASIIIARLFNPRMVKAEKEVQEQEATFRGFLLKTLSLQGLFAANLAEKKAAKVRLQYQLFTKSQLAVLQVLPYIVLIPSFFSGVITLGDLIKYQAAFTLIVVNAAVLLQLYPVWIKGKASTERVKDLYKEDENKVDMP